MALLSEPPGKVGGWLFIFKILLESSCFTVMLVSAVEQSESAIHIHISLLFLDFPGGSANTRDAGDTGWISGSGSSPGKGNGNPLQYSCLENPMDRGAW